MRAPGVRTWILSAVAAGWAFAGLLHHPPALFVVPPLFALGLMSMSRLPVLGATIVVLAQLAGLALGVPHDSPSGLMAGLAAMYVLGRRSRLPRALVPILLAWVAIVVIDLSPVRQVLGLGLFAAVFGLGFVVRTSAERTEAAETEALRLEAEEVTARARRIVAAERRRLAQDSARVLTVACREMRDLARAARTDLAPSTLFRIRERGESAVDDLRALLDMLRTPSTPAAPVAEPIATRPPWPPDTALAVLITALLMIESAADSSPLPFPTWLLVATGAVAVRRQAPSLSCWIVTFAFVGQWAGDEPFVTGPALACALALVTWSALSSTEWPRLLAVTSMAGACLLATVTSGHDSSVPVAAAILTGSAVGSRIWHLLAQQHASARERADAYSRSLRATVDAAVSNERIEVARDLHDVASRAIGVMLLHTSAAEAHRAADPAQAGRSLDIVIAAGDTALAELASFEHALHPEAATDHEVVLPLTQMRSLGLDIDASVSVPPQDPEVASAVWRITHEALTNALKHSPGSAVAVTVEAAGSDVVVTVRDDGTGRVGDGIGTGHGLRGMTELAERLGGSLRHGPVAGAHGYEVVARLPATSRVT